MTVEEARRFIDRAEQQSLDSVDSEQLAEAIRVLQEEFASLEAPAVPEAQAYLRRAQDLVQRVVDRQTHVRRARSADTERFTPEQLQQIAAQEPSGSPAAEGLGGQQARSEGGRPQLNPEFEKRLRDAAVGAGVPPTQVDQLIAQAAVVAEQAAQMGQGQTVTLESLLSSQLEQWEQEAARNAPTPIGVPQGFVAEPQVTLDPADRARFGGRERIGVEREAQYFEGDEIVPASMAPEEIVRIQRRLVDAGLLEQGGYWEGFWDAGTAQAYKQVLGYSNQRGTNWQSTIDALIESLPEDLEERKRQAEAAEAFIEPPYMKPDYASLAQEAKRMFRGTVGRDPTEEELAEMAGQLSGNWKAQHDAAVAAARAQFEAGQEGAGMEWAPSTGDPERIVGTPTDTVPTGTFQSVDPSARLAEWIERRFAPEIDRGEALPQVRDNMENVFANLRTMTSMVGGG